MPNPLNKKPIWLQYLFATRPSFLTITALACLIGYSFGQKPSNYLVQGLGLILAVFGHAAANVINDYYDSINGSDPLNTNRISPYTGGSRFIQNQVFSERQMKRFSLAIFGLTIVGGLFICYLTTWHLLGIGTLGLFLGWAYSATPFNLMSRGIWGELAIVMTWALITIGAALISHAESLIPVAIVGLAYGLMTANILFVNQIPDIDADRKANKLTLAVKVESKNIWKYYLIISSTAYLLMSTAYLLKLIQGNGYLFLALYPASICAT